MIKKLFMLFFFLIAGLFVLACDEKEIVDDSGKKDVFKDLVDITLKEGESYTFNVSESLMLMADKKDVVSLDDATKTINAISAA